MNTAKAETRQTVLTVLGATVALELVPGVFTPTPHGLFYANAARILPGERVIDIGTGSGVLAIAAAKLGAQVVATDVDTGAIAAAQRNAVLNGVSIDCRVGSFFADASGAFDVIIANLPNEIVAPAYLQSLTPEATRSIDGGPSGNAAILALLDAALPYMHARSRLYLPVSGMTDYQAVVRTALSRYAVRLVAVAPLAVKSFVSTNLDFYRPLAERGVIQLFRDAEGEWHSWEYVYELTLPIALPERRLL
jgi:methylase of polypeptide subunit release factors